jgi:hypothetical protein
MDIIVPKYLNKKTGTTRGNNICYQLQLNGSQIQEVCKKYFINTFGERFPERQLQNEEITMAITKKLTMI